MFPKIDADTARKNRRALMITLIAMTAFGMAVAGASVAFGTSPLFLAATLIIGVAYVYGTVAFIIHTEK